MEFGGQRGHGGIWAPGRCGDPQAVALSVAELGEPQPSSPDTKRLSECLRRIGDELDSNMELQRMIEQVGCDAPKKLFFRVAKEMFADGTFNWGRVVALFYFACKLVLKALCTKVPELVQTILRWTMEYLQEHVLAWIQAQGGWVRPQIPLRGPCPAIVPLRDPHLADHHHLRCWCPHGLADHLEDVIDSRGATFCPPLPPEPLPRLALPAGMVLTPSTFQGWGGF
uniref:BCL2 associated X, apoptosis regulator n=1 Tax=Taeniopygia guttata TaxID=59729 RepID=H0ZZC9_TAEGU